MGVLRDRPRERLGELAGVAGVGVLRDRPRERLG